MFGCITARRRLHSLSGCGYDCEWCTKDVNMTSNNECSTLPPADSEITCTVDEFLKDGFRTLIEATKCANDLPKGREFALQQADGRFTECLNAQSNRLLDLINDIFLENRVNGNIRATKWQNREETISDANDIILDRAVAGIDEIKGLKNSPAEPELQLVSAEVQINGTWNRVRNKNVATSNAAANQSVSLLTAKNIVRPQTYFKDAIDNSNAKPWTPRISDKPNSLKPLALYLEPADVDDDDGGGGFEEYSHPYEFELEHFTPPQEFIANVEELEAFRGTKETPFFEIATEEELDELVEALRAEKVVAVDLEHHSYRSFQGITCLLQISTRRNDYIVDALSLRHKLHVLNEIFTKPSILKIFHGANCDIQWLQRDLSLYVVNMFDTYQAAKLLDYSGLSLSYLLNRFCSFMPNKKFQLADWRIRPLPQELKDYAREDTHYLIYVYDRLKQELYAKANGDDRLVKAAFEESKQICKIKYVKPRLTPTSHMHLYQRRKKLFDNRQMYALKELYKWRDHRAREDDESIGYVLPNHMMLQIAEMLPREVQGIFACCNLIPPLVRAYSLELHHIILKAREQPLQKVIMQDTNRKAICKETVRINIDSPLHCPHDLTKRDIDDNLPTLLNEQPRRATIAEMLPLEKRMSSLHIFNALFDERQLVVPIKQLGPFLGPYERYKLMKPYLEAQAVKEEVEEEKDAAETNDEDDPSMKERIASLHQHFININNAASSSSSQPAGDAHILTSDQPLIHMAGAKKRKRDVSDDKLQVSNNERHSQQQQQVDFNRGKQSKKQKRGNKNKFRKNRGDYVQNAQYSTNSFDYSTVDFNQFAGGGRAVQQKQVNAKYRGRGHNRRGGGSYHAKSITYRRGKSRGC